MRAKSAKKNMLPMGISFDAYGINCRLPKNNTGKRLVTDT
jgi:hypothetical protein